MIVDTTVINIHHGQRYDVLIGRPSIFGNPFYTGPKTSRVERYKTYFLDKIAKEPTFREAVLALRGKRLGCFCSGVCHGMIIVEWLEQNAA